MRKASLSIIFLSVLIWIGCEKWPVLSTQNTNYSRNEDLPDTNQIRNWIDEFTQWSERRVGSNAWKAGIEWIEQEMQSIGLQNVSRDSFPIQYWECNTYSLTLDPQGVQIEVPVYYELYTGFTSPQGITAPMVYVGNQVDQNEDVSGKIAVIDLRFLYRSDGLPNPVIRPNHLSFEQDNILSANDAYWRAVEGGAVGVIWLMKDFRGDERDYYYIPHDESLRPIPAQFVGNRNALVVRCKAEEGATANMVQQGIYEPRMVWNVHGEIIGQSTSDWIAVSSHADSPFEGFIEDATGIASMLSIAQAWINKPVEERPKSLIFVATAAHLYKNSPGGTVFAQQNPGIFNQLDALIEIEHIGARKLSLGADTFVVSNTLEDLGIFHAPNAAISAQVDSFLLQNPPQEVINTISTQLPLTEASGWLAANPQLNYLSFITNPTYLLFRGDDQTKLDMQAFERVNGAIYNCSKRLMTQIP